MTTKFLYSCVGGNLSKLLWEKFGDTKSVIRSRNSKDRQYNDQNKKKNNGRQNRGELGSPGRIGSSCSNSGTHCVAHVKHFVIRHEWGKGRIVIMTNRTYLWSYVTDNQVMVVMYWSIFWSDEFNLITRNHLLSSFLVSSNVLSRKSR